MPDEPVGIAVEDDPSSKNAVESGGDETAVLWMEAAEELVRDRRDLVVPDRREREPPQHRPSW
ncbi:hypothetical protein QCN29_32000 [Streptomyces sp. HNM0663]|uniref:Uncharacterized protein n=1 Tax=Streptomyces chengmaiensis TaxID=3040919 RepID=A0ABT6HX76_9ACTN|nr:hypothetical protein [Streptomyces chengmaiensis]MDH2393307.1 hypothetical protein [Streptomyces chengmaiensis]